MDRLTRLAVAALVAAERSTVVLESPSQIAARYVAQAGYDERLVAYAAALESTQPRAVTVLGHAWRCLEGRMDVRRFCGYLKGLPHIVRRIEAEDWKSSSLAQTSVSLALRYTAWERARTLATPRIPEAILRGISEESAEQAISLAQRILGTEAIADVWKVDGSDRAAFGLPPLGPEPPPLDFNPSVTHQGDYGDRYLDPELAEALALERYFTAAGIVPAHDDATWSRVVEDHERKRPVDGTVQEVVSYGLAVSIYDPPVRAFLPLSQLVSRPRDIKRIKNPERWIARRERFQILRHDRSVGYIVLAAEAPARWHPFSSARPR